MQRLLRHRLIPLLLMFLAGSPVAGGSERPDPLVLHAPDGRLTVTAAPAAEAVRVDGALDDAVWKQATPVSAFVQSEPRAKTVRPTGGSSFANDADLGLDVKFGVTPALTLDLTVNPDFAQAEADEQQVNLTQFSQFFPEKREFFLENSGTFYVGDAARNNRVNPTPTPDEDLLLFFSRRIGLTASGEPIPILAGARLTGRVGGLDLGLLSVQTRGTDTEPANQFAVLRLRRNLFGHSDVGALFMTRQNTDDWNDYNRVFGIDTNIRFFGQLDWSSYAMKSETPGRGGRDQAWRTSLNREGNFFHGKGGVMQLGENFQDDLGYYRRVGVRKYFMDVGVRPRPLALARHGIREMHPHLVWDYYEDAEGRFLAKNLHSGYTFFLQNGGYVELSANPRYLSATTEARRITENNPGGSTSKPRRFVTSALKALDRAPTNLARSTDDRYASRGGSDADTELASIFEALPGRRAPPDSGRTRLGRFLAFAAPSATLHGLGSRQAQED